MRTFGKGRGAQSWLRLLFVCIAAVALSFAIWFGLRMTGVDALASAWVRGGLIVILLVSIGLGSYVKYARRRKAAQGLEDTLVASGDGNILARRMADALARLKQSGGKTYLYDLPWYVIIGPPGAGKTTALLHCGLEFPGTDKAAVVGLGGTRNCDFWFAEDAVLVDTAGRYTTQDSDAKADSASWLSFLTQLKRARPDQPINGVMLAFSCEDMMTATEDELEQNALAVRKRLAELHETLQIDVPVYAMFTKADIVAGFRDYFKPLGQDRRRTVWGVTFQTKDRSEETYRSAPAEFDKLISRLSDEVTDRLSEEHDTVARISAFGFPRQMALMHGSVTDFLRRVFENPKETHAILRGFYFTSGTQEGTPIDQALGAMASGHDVNAGFQPRFMSGKGRSYFLHDLLKQVIFKERDWVGYDARSIRLQRVLRAGVTTLMAAIFIGAVGVFGYSFWQNATLVRQSHAEMNRYIASAQDLLNMPMITDPATRPIMDALSNIRNITSGYTDTTPQPFIERVGLSRRQDIHASTVESYSYALEHLLRPRMMLTLENRLPVLLADQRYEQAFRALKVYLLLAKSQPGPDEDSAIQAYFADVWTEEYPAPDAKGAYDEINEHLAAMLALDGRVTPALQSNKVLVERAQRQLAALPFARRAYEDIVRVASQIAPLNINDELSGTQAQLVFRMPDLTVPHLFTFAGYWTVFTKELAKVQARLETDRWVLGAVGNTGAQHQMLNLKQDISRLYQADFVNAWTKIFEQIELMPMADHTGGFSALQAAATPAVSPILRLTEIVDRETRLDRLTGGIEHVEQMPSSIEVLEQPFSKWHAMTKNDGLGARPIDAVLLELQDLLRVQTRDANEGRGPTTNDVRVALDRLAERTAFLPDMLVRMIDQIESDFLPVPTNVTLE